MKIITYYMTKIINTLLSLILAVAALFAGFGSITTQAQYGGTTITLPSNPNSNTTVSKTSTSTVSNPNNKCAGSNVSSNIAGDTLNINLCNIKSGNTVVLNNLSSNFIDSIELTFNSDINDGLYQLVRIPESLAYSNINGYFITGFEALTTRFDSSAIRSVKLNFKVDKNTVAKYQAVNAYISSSPWTSASLTKISEDSTFVRYSSTTNSFKQFALSGTTLNSVSNATSTTTSTSLPVSSIDLIRTGGETHITGAVIFVLGVFAAYTVISKRNTLKI